MYCLTVDQFPHTPLLRRAMGPYNSHFRHPESFPPAFMDTCDASLTSAYLLAVGCLGENHDLITSTGSRHSYEVPHLLGNTFCSLHHKVCLTMGTISLLSPMARSFV
jgi:hypothetical protein